MLEALDIQKKERQETDISRYRIKDKFQGMKRPFISVLSKRLSEPEAQEVTYQAYLENYQAKFVRFYKTYNTYDEEKLSLVFIAIINY